MDHIQGPLTATGDYEMLTQQEIDSMSEALRAQGLTWNQTNFAVSLVCIESSRLQAQVDALAGALGDAMAQIRISPTLVRHPETADVLSRGAAALAAVGR